MKPVDYYKPRTLQEAWDLLGARPGARLIAGGTDVMVKIKNRDLRPAALVSLRSVEGLDGIEVGPTVRIGALTTIADLLRHGELGARCPVLVEAARRMAGAQVRNAATVGGNLCNCSPCADMAPPLLVLGARVLLEGPRGSRELPLRDFFRGPGETAAAPGEILTCVLFDAPAAGHRATFLKKGRVRMDLAIASVAALVELDGPRCTTARLAAGSVAPVPLRLARAEAILEGAAVTPALAAEAGRIAAESVAPISDIRAGEEYRRRITGVYVRRAIGSLMGWSGS